MNRIRCIMGGLAFFFGHFTDFVALMLTKSREKQIDVGARILKQAEDANPHPPLVALVHEWVGTAHFAQAEERTPEPADVISAWPSCSAAKDHYLACLPEYRRAQDRHLPTILYRIAVCLCRLGDFETPKQYLDEADAVIGHPNANVAKTRGLCEALQPYSKTRNVWEWLAWARKQDPLPEQDMAVLDDIDRKLNENTTMASSVCV